MRSLFALLAMRARLGPRSYLAAAVFVLAAQHLLLALIMWGFAPQGLWAAQLSPFPFLLVTSAGLSAPISDTLTFVSVVVTLIAALAMWSLGLARSADRGGGRELAALSMLPVVQLAAIPALALTKGPTSPSDDATVAVWADSTMAVAAGAGVAVTSVVLGALVFGVYGWTLFIFSPFLIGAVTGYVANRRVDLGVNRLVGLVALAQLIGGATLLSFALEGAVCLVMAAPFAFGLGLIGGLVGRSWAAAKHAPLADTFSALVALPLAFAMERGLSETTHFSTAESVEVRAPPMAVWQAVTHMGRINAEPGLPFRLGLSYPTAGVIRGEGVGAVREGQFSTGLAYERVTEWAPGRRLTFVILSDAPSLRELSPYREVHAPHVEGYFRTKTARFDIAALPGAVRG